MRFPNGSEFKHKAQVLVEDGKAGFVWLQAYLRRTWHALLGWLKAQPQWVTYVISGTALAIVVLLASLLFRGVAPREPLRVPLPAPPGQAPSAPPVLHGPVPEPTISLRVAGTQRVLWLRVEDYVPGVVAAEMEPTWPEEALKAQAVLARTFIMQKIADRERSRYGTVASTDINEFQAFRPARINARVRAAVKATRGQVLTHNGRFAYTFFHSCSGGVTATAEEGLDFRGARPAPYLTTVADPPCTNPRVRSWSVSVPAAQVARIAGLRGFSAISIGSHGPSGRALTIRVGNTNVSANRLRRAIGTGRMKSTLLTGISLRAGRVVISGRGWGHGVGLSQWGAHDRALRGDTYTQILNAYYPGTFLEKVW